MNRRIWRVALTITTVVLLGSSERPVSPRDALPGLWDISLSANGARAHRICLADPMYLTQWEHRTLPCRHDVIAERETSVTMDYNCPGAGFGHSVITLVTPRSLKVDTQGISGGLPFAYTLYARRVGECRGR